MKTSAHKNASSAPGGHPRHFKHFRLCLAAAIALIIPAMSMACGGEDKARNDGDGVGVFLYSVFVHNGDVYVAGTAYDETRNAGTHTTVTQSRAILWKNGEIICQYPERGPGVSGAHSVFVDDTDVYMAGYATGIAGSPYQTPVLWKNGVFQPLIQMPIRDSFATSVFVSGGDVYVAGIGSNSESALWKNGEEQHLGGGRPHSVFVSGGDVYVASWLHERGELWKNGEVQYLTGGNHITYLRSVFVSGSDVYVAGHATNINEYARALLWKNGAPQYLTDGKKHGSANSVFVYNGDVYVAGSDGYKAVMWKNGMVQNLAGNSGTAESVFVYNGDVYVVGGGPVVWKNGAIHQILAKE
jgi:hypothetical protein